MNLTTIKIDNERYAPKKLDTFEGHIIFYSFFNDIIDLL